jgi:hypothetical protein
MSKIIDLFLSNSQKLTFQKGNTFQMSAPQLQAGSGKHHVEIEMHPKHHQELLKNVSMGRGYRFSQDKIIGGSFLSGIVKKIGSTIAKKGADKVLDYVGKKTGHEGITNIIKNEAVDPLINFGADKLEKKIAGGSMPKKGSQEMRDRMSRLKSMRRPLGIHNDSIRIPESRFENKIDGNGIFDNWGKKIRKVFNPKKIKKVLTSPIAKKIYHEVADDGIDGISLVTGRAILGSIAKKVASEGINGIGMQKKSGMGIIKDIEHLVGLGVQPKKNLGKASCPI